MTRIFWGVSNGNFFFDAGAAGVFCFWNVLCGIPFSLSELG
ncbi:MAG: hypothetical protein QM303_11315 [Bacillota bacterium]|nr:hypothetical protein [Bacillota bacterium]